MKLNIYFDTVDKPMKRKTFGTKVDRKDRKIKGGPTPKNPRYNRKSKHGNKFLEDEVLEDFESFED